MAPFVLVDKSRWQPHQLRLWSHLRLKQDVFWPSSEWPAWVQELIVLPHKSDSQVFNLAVFFLVNGLDEATTFTWVLARDVRNGNFLEGSYSLKERQDVERIRFRWSSGTLPLEGKRVFDMKSGLPMNAGDYQQGYARSFGNRSSPVVTISASEPATRVYEEVQRYQSDDWIDE